MAILKNSDTLKGFFCRQVLTVFDDNLNDDDIMFLHMLT